MDTDVTGTAMYSTRTTSGTSSSGTGSSRPGPRAIVVMGVAGSGKTTVAALLAGRLGASFAEGDDFHSPANVAKMAAGHPLDDDDRWPWLNRIRDWFAAELAEGRSAVVPCSALRRNYRDLLATAGSSATGSDSTGTDSTGAVQFVHLTGSSELLRERIQGRAGHFMKPEMLDSQLAALEPLQDDEPGFVVDITPRPDQIVEEALRLLDIPSSTEHGGR
ncbi:gluconokinase [Promicromonospora iranensis]|uniref:Gluconokinase n=1 Tax=Promicromonospora iranensis TaxID=1105144 RepID=A0ABU2CWI6_9MICO|nr:gluconokinase [Promicromonospora iranensis]MDR7385715.1 gluconokinase [Promicromonospora iranensis]